MLKNPPKFPSRENKKHENGKYISGRKNDQKTVAKFICINVFVENILENTSHQENCMKNVVVILILFY